VVSKATDGDLAYLLTIERLSKLRMATALGF